MTSTQPGKLAQAVKHSATLLLTYTRPCGSGMSPPARSMPHSTVKMDPSEVV